MASTLTAYIPNTKITVTTSPIGFIDTTSYRGIIVEYEECRNVLIEGDGMYDHLPHDTLKKANPCVHQGTINTFMLETSFHIATPYLR